MVQPDKSLFALLAIPSACTVSLMAIFLAFNIGYNFAEHIGDLAPDAHITFYKQGEYVDMCVGPQCP